MAEATSSEEDAQTQRLKDLASSPSINGLPGLIFAPDENGSIINLKHAGVLRLLVNDTHSTTAQDRFMAGIRTGIWFQHGLKIAVENPDMKRADNRMYALIQESVRSEYGLVATHPVYAGKKLKAMFAIFEEARIRFKKDEASTQPPINDDPITEIETAFLQPLDLWVNLFTAVKHSRRHAKTFVQTADWSHNILNEYKNKTGIDPCVAPEPIRLPHGEEPENTARDPGTRKRPRTDDDADTAMMPAHEATKDFMAMIFQSDQFRQDTHDRLNLYLQEIKRNIEQQAEAEIGKLSIDNRDLRVAIATVRGEKAEAVAILQRELNEKNAENGDALAKIADLEVEMAKLRIDAEIAGMPASETKYRILRANERIETAEAKARAAMEELQDAKAIVQARDEELQVAVTKAQAAEEQEQVVKKEMEEVQASQDELIKARDAAMEEMRAELAAKDKEMEEILCQKAELAQKLAGSQKGGSSPVMMDLDTKTE